MTALCLDFKTEKGFDCLLGNVRNILNYHGVGITESQLFILGNGLKVTYCYTTDHVDKIGGSPFQCLRRLALCFDTDVSSVSENLMVKPLLRQALENGKPLIFAVDPAKLGYHQEVHSSGPVHFVTPTGISSMQNTDQMQIKISDPFIPMRPSDIYNMYITVTEFQEAWQSLGSILIRIPDSLIEKMRGVSDYNLLCMDALCRCLNEFLAGGKDDDNCFTGISALWELHKNYDEYYEHLVQLNQQEFISKKLKLWNILNARILLTDLLNQFTGTYRQCVIESKDALMVCCQQWEMFINQLILKYIRDSSRLKSGHINPKEKLTDIITYEKEQFTDLLKKIQVLRRGI